MKELFEFIYDLITEFDEMGFVPTTTVPEDPKVYAIRWRDAMIEALQDLSKQSEKYLIKENGDILPLTHHSEWISVKDRLPEARKQVLLYSPTDGFNIGFMYEDKRFYVGKPYPDRPTHWMPLPSAPEMKGGAA